jgi:signal transduction histidine kinase
MLEGQDQDWKEVVNDRQAQYTNLPPRHYRFRVIASNNSGVWNEQGDTLEFSIAPAYYQKNWFRGLCVAAVLGLLWAAYQFRARQLHQQFEMTLQARVGERTRIARELHDTLLQSFQGILLHLQRLSNRLQQSETKQALDSAIEQAAQAIVEGRDAVQDLRASTVESNDLGLAIRTLGEEFGAADNLSRRPEFSVRLEGTPQSLHPIVRDEVYRLAGEAMRNAFRHAEAQRIEVEIRYDERQLRVRVRDDGKGIDPILIRADGREGHFGLHGMRERAKLIGGSLTLWSELDSGTEVELSIPAARAYTRASKGHGSLLEKFFAKLWGRGTGKES